MLKINDVNKLKITKIRDWRINFKYNDVQYSLNYINDCESVIRLINLDTKEDISSIYDSLNTSHYIKMRTYDGYNKPCVYSHIDKLYFVKCLCEKGFAESDEEINENVDISILNDQLNRLQGKIHQTKKDLKKIDKFFIF